MLTAPAGEKGTAPVEECIDGCGSHPSTSPPYLELAKPQDPVRRRGGGAKRLYRIVDFKRTKFDIPATVERIEYDPNRTAFIALVKYEDGEQAYILAPQRLAVGDQVVAHRGCEVACKVTLEGRTFKICLNCEGRLDDLSTGRAGHLGGQRPGHLVDPEFHPSFSTSFVWIRN